LYAGSIPTQASKYAMQKPKLVLMSCCAPCSAAAIARLKNRGGDFVVLFHNPNIFPRSEYDKRLAEQIKLCGRHGVECAVGDYDHEAWLAGIKGMEAEPERGARCGKCFAIRFAWGAKWALARRYGAITSCFGVSPRKDQDQVNAAAGGLPIQYVDCDFGYAPDPDSYRQKYCGCEFSETYGAAKNGE
jgi:predicted adenine nucleotide alpha hydrolase (AANH) superfamily ATPase